MAQITFNPGDVVKLVSGGPVMTVANVANGVVKCVWFNNASSQYTESTIAATLLVKQIPFGNQ